MNNKTDLKHIEKRINQAGIISSMCLYLAIIPSIILIFMVSLLNNNLWAITLPFIIVLLTSVVSFDVIKQRWILMKFILYGKKK